MRLFHLYNDVPLLLFIDEYGIMKTEPGQKGFSVTGNRRQNFAEFSINDFGYNSYRAFKPSKDKLEIAYSAQLSAITIFLNKPHRICRIPSTAFE